MKNFIFLLCTLLLVWPVLAQEADDEKITRVEITIEKDGETRTITREMKDEDFDGDVRVYRFEADEKGLYESFPKERYELRKTLEHYFKRGEEKVEEVAFMGVTGHMQQIGETSVVMLDKIIEGEPADKAGLQPGDIVLKVNQEELESYEELVEAIRSYEPGQLIQLEIKREGRKDKVDLILGKRELSTAYHLDWEADDTMLVQRQMRFFLMNELSDEERSIIHKNTGIEMGDEISLDDADLELYPNPTPGNLAFELSLSEGGKLEVEIYNDAGEAVAKTNMRNAEGQFAASLDISDQPVGHYLVLFKLGDKILVEKILKI